MDTNTKRMRASIAKTVIVAVVLASLGTTAPQSADAATQNSWRWRNDDGTEITATWAADEATDLGNIASGSTRRLRFGAKNDGGFNDQMTRLDGVELTQESSGSWSRVSKINESKYRYLSAVADPSGGYAYFAGEDWGGADSVEVFKVQTSTNTIVDQFTMANGIYQVTAAELDDTNNYVYMLGQSGTGYVVRIDLSTFTATYLARPNNNGTDMALDVAGGYGYVSEGSGKLWRFDLNTFADAGTLDMVSGSPNLSGDTDFNVVTLATDSGTDYAYLSTDSVWVRVDLSSFAYVSQITTTTAHYAAASRIGDSNILFDNGTQACRLSTTLSSAATCASSGLSGNIYRMELNPAGTHLYAMGYTDPTEVAVMQTQDMAAVHKFEAETGDKYGSGFAIDFTNDKMWFGTDTGNYGSDFIVQYNIDENFSGPAPEDIYGEMAISSTGDYVYAGTYTVPGQIFKLRTSDMTVVDKLLLNPGDDYITGVIIDDADDYLYASLDTSPGGVVRIRLSDLTRQGRINTTEDYVQTMVLDEEEDHLYFAGYDPGVLVYRVDVASGNFAVDGSPLDLTGDSDGAGQAWSMAIDTSGTTNYLYLGDDDMAPNGGIAKINLDTFTKTGWLSLESDEYYPDSMVVDGANGYLYTALAMWSSTLIKIRMSDMTRIDELTFGAPFGYPGALEGDLDNGYLYALDSNNTPSYLSKVRLSDFTEVSQEQLSAGDSSGWEGLVIDPANNVGYYGSEDNPADIVKFELTPSFEFGVEYCDQSYNCSLPTNWHAVPTTATTEHWQMSDSSYVTDGELTTNVAGGVTDGNSVFVSGRVLDSSNKSACIVIPENGFTEMEFAMEPTDAAIGNNYSFRLVDDGTALETYDSYPNGGATSGSTDPTVNNQVALSRLKQDETANVTVSFTLQNILDGTLTVTFPVGFTVTGAPTGGSACLSEFGMDAGTRTIYATKTACSGSITLTGATVVNPSIPGAYTVSWVNDDPGNGQVYITDDDQVSVTGNVDPTLTFDLDVGIGAGETPGSYAVDLGALTSSAPSGSDNSSIDSVFIDLATNATGGATVTVRSAYAALRSASNPTDEISSGTATLAGGTEGYGICVASATGTQDGGDTFGAQSPYASTCTAGSFSVGLLQATAQDLLVASGPIASGSAEVRVAASISTVTPAHPDYTDTLTFLAAATY